MADNKKLLLDTVNALELKKKVYGISTTKLQKHQEQLLPFISDNMIINEIIVPRYKYLLYQ
jgi:hypothetical protein